MYGPSEHVFVESEWYDGPRAGIASVNGQPHRFVSQWDEEEDEYLGTFLVWPVDAEELALEREQWCIFVAWNALYEAGEVDTASHPGHSGTNKRWDEIALQLSGRREAVPPGAKRAKAKVVHLEREHRYAPSGPAYQLSWRLL